jgi:hypothetical protein
MLLADGIVLSIRYTVSVSPEQSICLKTAVFWVVAPCSMVEVYLRFRRPCCLHHQADRPRRPKTQKTAIFIFAAVRTRNLTTDSLVRSLIIRRQHLLLLAILFDPSAWISVCFVTAVCLRDLGPLRMASMTSELFWVNDLWVGGVSGACLSGWWRYHEEFSHVVTWAGVCLAIPWGHFRLQKRGADFDVKWSSLLSDFNQNVNVYNPQKQSPWKFQLLHVNDRLTWRIFANTLNGWNQKFETDRNFCSLISFTRGMAPGLELGASRDITDEIKVREALRVP